MKLNEKNSLCSKSGIIKYNEDLSIKDIFNEFYNSDIIIDVTASLVIPIFLTFFIHLATASIENGNYVAFLIYIIVVFSLALFARYYLSWLGIIAVFVCALYFILLKLGFAYSWLLIPVFLIIVSARIFLAFYHTESDRLMYFERLNNRAKISENLIVKLIMQNKRFFNISNVSPELIFKDFGEGWSPLLLAVANESNDSLKRLLSAEHLINERTLNSANSNNLTILDIAIEKRMPEVLSNLLEVCKTNNIRIANYEEKIMNVLRLDDREFFELLLINYKEVAKGKSNLDLNNLLFEAVKLNSFKISEFLQNNGAEPLHKVNDNPPFNVVELVIIKEDIELDKKEEIIKKMLPDCDNSSKEKKEESFSKTAPFEISDTIKEEQVSFKDIYLTLFNKSNLKKWIKVLDEQGAVESPGKIVTNTGNLLHISIDCKCYETDCVKTNVKPGSEKDSCFVELDSSISEILEKLRSTDSSVNSNRSIDWDRFWEDVNKQNKYYYKYEETRTCEEDGCKGGHKDCECVSTGTPGYSDCDNKRCDGHGFEDCPKCNTGINNLPPGRYYKNDFAKGSTQCNKCKGNEGKINCRNKCSQTYDSTLGKQRRTVKCKKCEGELKVSCPNCDGGEVDYYTQLWVKFCSCFEDREIVCETSPTALIGNDFYGFTKTIVAEKLINLQNVHTSTAVINKKDKLDEYFIDECLKSIIKQILESGLCDKKESYLASKITIKPVNYKALSIPDSSINAIILEDEIVLDSLTIS